MPLLTRSTFDLAVNIATFIVLENSNVTFGTIIALYVFDGLCWMLAFVGIVLISKQDSSSPTPTPFDTEKSMQATTAGVLIADKSGSSSS